MKKDSPGGVTPGPLSPTDAALATDALPSWNDGPAKQSIFSFVEKVTQEGSPSFVPVAERVATFDNDGTLWCEQPVPVQVYFAHDRVQALVSQHLEWQTTEPFASLLRGDLSATLAAGEEALLEVVMATHAGMTTTEFGRIVEDWIATAKHPRTGRLFTEMVYQPMLELLAYLRANGFKNFIVSGGGIEFLRQWGERVYGVAPEQVIGSSIKTRFEARDGKPVLMRLPQLNVNNDKAEKPVAIHQHIGRWPIAAFGNSVGDQHMLEYTHGGSGARFGLLVLHDDAAREYAYGPALGLPTPQTGAFTPALYEQAKTAGWTVVSMKDDWKQVFPFEAGPVTAINILLEPDATMHGAPKPTTPACSKCSRRVSRWMRRAVRMSRCCSVSCAQQTSTRSTRPLARCLPAPMCSDCAWRPSTTTTSRAAALDLRALSPGRVLNCASCNRA